MIAIEIFSLPATGFSSRVAFMRSLRYRDAEPLFIYAFRSVIDHQTAAGSNISLQ